MPEGRRWCLVSVVMAVLTVVVVVLVYTGAVVGLGDGLVEHMIGVPVLFPLKLITAWLALQLQLAQQVRAEILKAPARSSSPPECDGAVNVSLVHDPHGTIGRVFGVIGSVRDAPVARAS